MKNEKGFTLIEMIVVIAVFLFAISTAITIFISIVQHQRRILQEQELLNQASYAIEHMSKALRMAARDNSGDCLDSAASDSPYKGYTYRLVDPNSLVGYYQGLAFYNGSDTDSSGQPICYKFFVEDGVLKEKKGDEDAMPLISPDKFEVKSIRFGINGGNGSSAGLEKDTIGVQTKITILMDIEAKGPGSELRKKVQTTISQRNLNVP